MFLNFAHVKAGVHEAYHFMSDGEDSNVVNSHLSQNGQDGEVGSQSGSKN